jgi:DnaJ-class molecular chaperone
MMMSGGFTHFKTVDGATMQVRIPSGIKPLTLLKVKGRGLWKDSRTVSRGDCLLRVVPNVLKPHEYSQEEVDQFLKAREDFKTQE